MNAARPGVLASAHRRISFTPLIGLVIGAAAALHKLLYASVLTNDDFMHRVYALQLLAGDRPVRDFFDDGMGLMYAVSAAAQWVFGYRLLSEAIVIALATGVSAFLVYDVVRRTTGSVLAATLSALLLLAAMPRGYGYPKLIVYAVAAALWWRYVRTPSRGAMWALAAWAAIAFYWRPDHGVYVAIGVALAVVAAHGAGALAVTRCLQAATITLVLIAPWLIFAAVETGGLGRFVRSGVTVAFEEHRDQTVPRWPLRTPGDVIRVDSPESYAPTIGIRWTEDSSPEQRQDLLHRYELTTVSARDSTTRARVSAQSVAMLRRLLAEPIVEDTNGIDRGSARLSGWSSWLSIERWRFEHWWFRVTLFPALGGRAEAANAAALLLFAVPLAGLAGAGLLGRVLPGTVTALQLGSFSAFAVLVDLGLVREPLHVRVGDAVVLPAIVMGVLLASLMRVTRGMRRASPRWLVRACSAVVVFMTMKSLAVAGQSGEQVRKVADKWIATGSLSRALQDSVTRPLWASPPIDYRRVDHPDNTLQLAAYAHACLGPADRILVLWFAPEIYYYADRLMAGRHVFFMSALGRLAYEREMEMHKIMRSPPQIVFTRSLSGHDTLSSLPELRDLIARDYRVGGTIDDSDPYVILVRKDRDPVRPYGPGQWPCYR